MWEDLMTQFFVGLVNVPLGEDVEGGADESKEGGVEVDRAVCIQGHVHGDETLEVKVSTKDNNGGGEPCRPHDEDRAFQSRVGGRFSWENIEGFEIDATNLRRVTTSTCLMNPLASGSYSLHR